jgi:TnpA family transposase
MRNLTASDRSALIKLASSLPSDSPERKAILASLGKTANNSSMLAESLKKKWSYVTYDPGLNQGEANLGGLKITFYESVGSVIITIDETPYIKTDAETGLKLLNAINAAFRMA